MDGVEKDNTWHLEIIGTVILSIASLAVAWCTYQSTIWNGKQVFCLAKSNTYYRQSLEEMFKAWQQQQIDAVVTLNFLEAVLEQRHMQVDYYRNRSRPELRNIFNAWLMTNPVHNNSAPAHPLLMEEYKMMIRSSRAAADSTRAKGDRLWDQAQQYNSISDRYILYTVIFSLVMLLCAVATKLTRLRIAFMSMLVTGTIFFIALMLLLILMPIANIS